MIDKIITIAMIVSSLLLVGVAIYWIKEMKRNHYYNSLFKKERMALDKMKIIQQEYLDKEKEFNDYCLTEGMDATVKAWQKEQLLKISDKFNEAYQEYKKVSKEIEAQGL